MHTNHLNNKIALILVTAHTIIPSEAWIIRKDWMHQRGNKTVLIIIGCLLSNFWPFIKVCSYVMCR